MNNKRLGLSSIRGAAAVLRQHAVVALAACAVGLTPAIACADEPAIEPVLILVDGLKAATDTLLAEGVLLEPGDPLLPGDLVLVGAMINENPAAAPLIIDGNFFTLDEGTVLYTVDPVSPTTRCACKCGNSWRTLPLNSSDCAAWGQENMVGRTCIDTSTGQVAVWTECAQVTGMNP